MRKTKRRGSSNGGSHTAAEVMSTQVPVVTPDKTIGDVEKLLLRDPRRFDSIHYIYVVNRKGVLEGTLSVREVFAQKNTASVARVMHRKVVSVHPGMHQERVALTALRHDIKAVPVVDHDGRFLGTVIGDDLLKILQHAHQGRLFRIAGMKAPSRENSPFDDVLQLSVFQSLWHRLPWLILGLLGGVITARIVSAHEMTLARNLLLAAYVPLIVYLASAVGTQMSAFIIRDFALHPKLRFGPYFLRQMTVVIMLAVALSFVLHALSFAIHRDPRFSAVLAIALVIAVLSSIFTGLLIPYLFGRLRWDPANASGPIGTIIQDLLSVTVYFAIAAWLL